MRKSPPAIRCLSDAGNADNSDRERSSVREEAPLEILRQFNLGVPVLSPPPPIRVRVDGRIPLEDMPWSLHCEVVSDRFRKFIEEHAPEHAQFFQVDFYGPKKLLPTQPYYIINWIRVIDCIDMQKSDYERYEILGSNGVFRNRFYSIVIDENRVQDDVKVFRLKHCEHYVGIRDDFAKQMRAAGLTGIQIYDLPHRHDMKQP